MAVECTFSFILKIIVSLHILELKVFFFTGWNFSPPTTHWKCQERFHLKFWSSLQTSVFKTFTWLQLRFFKKLPAISLKLEFKLRVKCAPKSLGFVQSDFMSNLYGALWFMHFFFNQRKQYVFKIELWQPH